MRIVSLRSSRALPSRPPVPARVASSSFRCFARVSKRRKGRSMNGSLRRWPAPGGPFPWSRAALAQAVTPRLRLRPPRPGRARLHRRQPIEEEVVVSATKIAEDLSTSRHHGQLAARSCAARGTRPSPTPCRTSSASTRATAPTTVRACRTSGLRRQGVRRPDGHPRRGAGRRAVQPEPRDDPGRRHRPDRDRPGPTGHALRRLGVRGHGQDLHPRGAASWGSAPVGGFGAFTQG